jgi:hyperosmotically inducible periplasmic protein
MRRFGSVVTSALLLGGAWGCSHERAAENGTTASYAAPKSDFAAAYDAVKGGARQTATAGKLAFKGVGAGAVEVTDQSKEALSRTGNKVEDGWITTKVKTELATTKGVKSGDVHVDTDAGVVRLSGTVDSPRAAERAIETALKIKGVAAVDSQLQYPIERVAPRTYVPPAGTSY